MKFSEAIKPVSFFKNHMAQALRQINESQGTMIITQNGQAKAAIVDIRQYEEMQETMAMLELIAQGKEDLRAGRHRPAEEVFQELKERYSEEDIS